MGNHSISKDEGIDLLGDALHDRDYDRRAQNAPFGSTYDPFLTARRRYEWDNHARGLWHQWGFGRAVPWIKFEQRFLETFSRKPWRKDRAIKCDTFGAPARVSSQAAVPSPEIEQKNLGGKPLSIAKEIYHEIIRIAHTPDGLPDRAELMPQLTAKFPDASESNLRSILKGVYQALKLG
jgi:hypothetical protein